jgi:hypothetical protein
VSVCPEFPLGERTLERHIQYIFLHCSWVKYLASSPAPEAENFISCHW